MPRAETLAAAMKCHVLYNSKIEENVNSDKSIYNNNLSEIFKLKRVITQVRLKYSETEYRLETRFLLQNFCTHY